MQEGAPVFPTDASPRTDRPPSSAACGLKAGPPPEGTWTPAGAHTQPAEQASPRALLRVRLTRAGRQPLGPRGVQGLRRSTCWRGWTPGASPLLPWAPLHSGNFLPFLLPVPVATWVTNGLRGLSQGSQQSPAPGGGGRWCWWLGTASIHFARESEPTALSCPNPVLLSLSREGNMTSPPGDPVTAQPTPLPGVGFLTTGGIGNSGSEKGHCSRSSRSRGDT